MGLQQIFPPQVWVLKRELLWLPFFRLGASPHCRPLPSTAAASIAHYAKPSARGGQRPARGDLGRGVSQRVLGLLPESTGVYLAGGGLLATEDGLPCGARGA